MLLRVTKMCCARLDAVQVSQIGDLTTATFIVEMMGEGGQAGGGLAFFVVMMTPFGLLITPEKQKSPQATSSTHAHNAAPLSNRFWRVPGGYRMGLLQTASCNHARMEILGGILCS